MNPRSSPDGILATALEQLGHDGWRERKEAVGRIQAALSLLDDAEGTAVEELLVGRLLATSRVHERAALLEVLSTRGQRLRHVILTRLPSSGPGARLLVDLLAVLGTTEDAPLLAGIAGDATADANLRAAAISALGSVGGEGAADVLLALVEDRDASLRTYVIEALRACQVEVPPATLATALADPITRKGAVALLARSRSAEAAEQLATWLDDAMPGVRAAAVEGLAALVADADMGARRVRAAVARHGDVAARRIAELVRHRSSEARRAALRVGTAMREVAIIPAVLAAADDPELVELSLELVRDLGPAAADALADAAPLVGPDRRAGYFRLVGALAPAHADARLQTLLAEGLSDASEEIAAAAAEALRAVGGRSCLGALYRTMATEGPSGEMAAEAVAEVLARVGGPRFEDLDLIVGPAWPQDGAVARNLCRVVGRVGSSGHVPQLVAMLGSTDVGVRMAAAQALGHVPGEHEGVGALAFALADEEATVRSAAARSLGQLRAPQAVQSLLSATSDPSAMVRAAAVQALVATDNPVALPRYREVVAEDPVPAVVVHAIAGLGRSGSEHDLGMLMSLCMSADHEVVKAAARALRGYPAHRATAALLGLASHDRWDVRWAAADVLATRGDATALVPLRRFLEQEPDDLVRQVLVDAIARLESGSEPGSAR